jgi:hypothetical protein
VLAAQRVQYVDTMLQNSYAGGPETERGIMSVISGYGGGYVTSAVLGGTGGTPSQKLTLDVVIGAGQVTNSMQGEGDMSPGDPECYVFTVGFYTYEVKHSQVPCSSTLTTKKAQAIAARQIAAQGVSEDYGSSGQAVIPGSIKQAETEIGFDGRTALTTAPTGTDFAAGPGPEGKRAAGLALPQPGGACVDVLFRWIRATSKIGTDFTVTDAPAIVAWAAPTEAPCSGDAVLAEAGFLTVDEYAGG